MEVSLRGSYGVQLHLLNGLPYLHHCHIAGLLAGGVPIVPQLASIFMLRCDRNRSCWPAYVSWADSCTTGVMVW